MFGLFYTNQAINAELIIGKLNIYVYIYIADVSVIIFLKIQN